MHHKLIIKVEFPFIKLKFKAKYFLLNCVPEVVSREMVLTHLRVGRGFPRAQIFSNLDGDSPAWLPDGKI